MDKNDFKNNLLEKFAEIFEMFAIIKTRAL